MSDNRSNAPIALRLGDDVDVSEIFTTSRLSHKVVETLLKKLLLWAGKLVFVNNGDGKRQRVWIQTVVVADDAGTGVVVQVKFQLAGFSLDDASVEEECKKLAEKVFKSADDTLLELNKAIAGTQLVDKTKDAHDAGGHGGDQGGHDRGQRQSGQRQGGGQGGRQRDQGV